MTKKITYKVVGEQTMHCGGCERTVKFTLKRLPGVEAVEADHRTQQIEVSLNADETDAAEIKGALDWIGYEVESA